MLQSLDRLKLSMADRYTIERLIGAGGMAEVYLAPAAFPTYCSPGPTPTIPAGRARAVTT
jgi:hypothetical protein